VEKSQQEALTVLGEVESVLGMVVDSAEEATLIDSAREHIDFVDSYKSIVMNDPGELKLTLYGVRAVRQYCVDAQRHAANGNWKLALIGVNHALAALPGEKVPPRVLPSP
jgi:hypothetical protein